MARVRTRLKEQNPHDRMTVILEDMRHANLLPSAEAEASQVTPEEAATTMFGKDSDITKLSLHTGFMRDLLSPAPRGLDLVQAELLFLKDQLVFHWRDTRGKEERFKFLSLEQAVTAFGQTPVDSGWLQDGVFKWGSGNAGEYLAQYIPAGMHDISIKYEVGNFLSLRVPLPPLVFFAWGRKYFLWAVKDDAHMFSGNSIVCHAPLPNINNDGLVCMGDNQLPETRSESLKQIWRLLIELSPFNDHWANGKSLAYPNDIRSMLMKLDQKRGEHDRRNQRHWQEDEMMLAEQTTSIYPLDDLMPIESGRYRSGITVNQMLGILLRLS